MALPATGAISLNQVNTELQRAATAAISMNDTDVRTLAVKPSGAISMSDLHGKAWWTYKTGNFVTMTSNSAPAPKTVNDYSALPDGGAISGAEYLVYDNNTGSYRQKSTGWGGTRIGSQLNFGKSIKVRTVYMNAGLYWTPNTYATGNYGLQLYSATRGAWIDVVRNDSTHATDVIGSFNVNSAYNEDLFTAMRAWIGYNAGDVGGNFYLKSAMVTAWYEQG